MSDASPERPEPAAQSSIPNASFKEFLPHAGDMESHSEVSFPDLKISKGGFSETLAVLALLVPLMVECVFLLGSIENGMAVGFGAVLVTALLLGIDAYLLGRIDLEGKKRERPFVLFLAILLIWIIFFPLAYFRRRHFGRPNLGVLAIIVAVLFIGGPFIKDGIIEGIFQDGAPPTCTRPEVVRLVQETIRKSALGPAVKTIHGHREIGYDPVSKVRTGQCVAETDQGPRTLTFEVAWIDARNRMFKVEVREVHQEDPPACNSPEAIGILKNLIKSAPIGPEVTAIEGWRETKYDREAKIRYGECTVRLGRDSMPVAYKIMWLNQKMGQFQVQLMD